MRPDPLFAHLPDREDVGIDEDYGECRAMRGLVYGILFSLPFWIVIGLVIYHFTHRH